MTRERTDEIDGLIDHFCRTLPSGPYTMDLPARALLKSYDYPDGNVRELRRAIIRMTADKPDDSKLLIYAGAPAYIRDSVTEMTGASGPAELMEKIREIKESGVTEDLTVVWRPGERWEVYWSRCLLAAIRFACKDGSKSFRELSPILGMQRVTLSRKVADMVDSGMLTEAEHRRLFKGRDDE